MRISWTAAGSARDAGMAIADQARESRRQYPRAGATIIAARDELLTMLAGREGEVLVSATVALMVTEVAPVVVEMVAVDDEAEVVAEVETKRRRFA